jgi:hypothetical protein
MLRFSKPARSLLPLSQQSAASSGNFFRSVWLGEKAASLNVARWRYRVSRGVKDRNGRMARAKGIRHIPPVNLAAQPDVGEQDIDFCMDIEKLEGIFSVCGF